MQSARQPFVPYVRHFIHSLTHLLPYSLTRYNPGTSTLFALDRDTFRYVIATSQDSKANDVRSALTKVPLLSSLTEKQLQKICDSVEIVPYKTGDVIIKKGDVGDIFFMIKSGRVAVTEVNASNEVTYGPGDHFGERALLTGKKAIEIVH